ncbi:ESX secretion-associated protein EspG [Saccharopolyspora cebuensis]|uniref:ESX secretion-associated protein EspG n=1 Tax=Saccharopolyspora cebuensis TaxID=418759 RepID=A0ABV4CLG6_9PSEU
MTTARTAQRGGTGLGPVELDLLATHAGVPLPFPLRVPSFGRIAGEREVLFGVAGRTLRARGLADDDGPTGAAAELVTALREHRGTVDLVLTGGSGSRAVVALVHRSWALICEQPLRGEPADEVSVRRVPAHALADPLLAAVPDLDAARSLPIALPEQVIEEAGRVLAEAGEDAAGARSLRDLVRRCGGDPAALDRLTGVLAQPTGRGQLGATRRTATGSTRSGAELSWLDGPLGRLRVDRARDGWVSINPLRRADLRRELDALAAIARAPR